VRYASSKGPVRMQPQQTMRCTRADQPNPRRARMGTVEFSLQLQDGVWRNQPSNGPYRPNKGHKTAAPLAHYARVRLCEQSKERERPKKPGWNVCTQSAALVQSVPWPLTFPKLRGEEIDLECAIESFEPFLACQALFSLLIILLYLNEKNIKLIYRT
jgi:hypothetical protein